MTGVGRKLFVAAVIAAVLAAVAAGLSLLRTPGEERVRRVDARRVDDLRAISEAIDVYRSRRDRLPATLDEVAAETGLASRLLDPETQQPYEYRELGAKEYELCARFALELATREAVPDFWAHGPDRQCFRPSARDVPR
jgi:hypothetical protein